MRCGHVVTGAVFLVPLLAVIACKNPLKQAAGEVASAQALASAAKTPIPVVSVTGNIHSVGGELGTWDTPLSDCQSGEYNGFYGVDLLVKGTTNLRLRYVHDEASGEVVKVFYPSQANKAKVFDRTQKCVVLEGGVEKMNGQTKVDQRWIRHLKGHVKFDCTSSDQGHVTGEATFSDCH